MEDVVAAATLPEYAYKGKHVFLDFINFYDDRLEECCQYIFDVMSESIRRTTMRNMFGKMIKLEGDTEAGFTSVILLDESHITCHSYTQQGLLALDVFTCGRTDPNVVATFIRGEIEKKYPSIECIQHQVHCRFKHRVEKEVKSV